MQVQRFLSFVKHACLREEAGPGARYVSGHAACMRSSPPTGPVEGSQAPLRGREEGLGKWTSQQRPTNPEEVGRQATINTSPMTGSAVSVQDAP